MKYTRTDLENNKVQLEVAIETEAMQAYHRKALRQLGKEIKVPGFRQGHVPLEVLERMVRPDQLAQAETGEAINETMAELIERENLQLIDQPSVEPTKYVPGQTLEMKVTVEVAPKVELANPTKLKVKKPTAKIDDKQIDQVVDNLRAGAAKRQAVDRPAQKGDEVIIDFTGLKDGVEFDGGKAKDYTLELGSGSFIPGFEDGIVGHSAGDKFDVEVTFPKDYGAKNLAGHQAVFKIELKKVNELTLPELNDDFAKSYAPDLKTLADLRADIKKQLLMQEEAGIMHDYREAILDKLAEASKVEVPAKMIDNQLPQMKQDFAQNLLFRGLDLKGYLEQMGKTEDEWVKDDLRPSIEKQIRNSLVLRQVMTDYSIEVSDADVKQRQDEILSHYSDARMKANFETPDAKQRIRGDLLTERIFAKLIELNETK